MRLRQKGQIEVGVRVFLEDWNTEHSKPTDESGLLETLFDADIIQSETSIVKRWWYEEQRIVKLGSTYISYPWAISTRDMSAIESGWIMDLSRIQFMRPQKRTIIVWVPEE